MKNEGLIRHRQIEVSNDSSSDEKKLAGVGFVVFILTIEIWAAAGWGLFWFVERWGGVGLHPKWWELNAASAIVAFVRVWDRAFFNPGR